MLQIGSNKTSRHFSLHDCLCITLVQGWTFVDPSDKCHHQFAKMQEDTVKALC